MEEEEVEFTPSLEYLELCEEPSIYLPFSVKKHQLLVLDLNGTLISRLKTILDFYARPHHEAFFKFIFEHFHVMVWSSARVNSVSYMCKVFGNYQSQLIMMWHRSHFDLDQTSFYSNAKTYKQLEKIWSLKPEFNATNTIVLDDSPYKLKYQPHNLVHMSTFDHVDSADDYDLLKVMNYLLILKQQSNVASFMRLYPFDFQKQWGVVKDKVDSCEMVRFKGERKPTKTHIRFDEDDNNNENEDVFNELDRIIPQNNSTVSERTVTLPMPNPIIPPNALLPPDASIPPNPITPTESNRRKRRRRRNGAMRAGGASMETRQSNTIPVQNVTPITKKKNKKNNTVRIGASTARLLRKYGDMPTRNSGGTFP